MDLSRTNVVVIVFVMEGCGACHDYLPRLREIGKGYPGVPVVIQDVGKMTDEVQNTADRFNVSATPTTIVAKRGPGFVKAEGAVSDAEIRDLFETANRWR